MYLGIYKSYGPVIISIFRLGVLDPVADVIKALRCWMRGCFIVHCIHDVIVKAS